MPRLEKMARAILITLILILAVVDVFIVIDLILSDPVGCLRFN